MLSLLSLETLRIMQADLSAKLTFRASARGERAQIGAALEAIKAELQTREARLSAMAAELDA